MDFFSFRRKLKNVGFTEPAKGKRKCRGWDVAGRPGGTAERLENRRLLKRRDDHHAG